ncbi:MAG: hypothetical protein FWC93_01085 [Defluviitaleaceae bacterium]|nr:hypothetical protein [Defluviitaleaceae bacterium]
MDALSVRLTDACTVKNQSTVDLNHLRIEPIITLKVYSSRKAKDCLTSIARASEPVYIDYESVKKGDIIPVHHDAKSIDINNLKIKHIKIASKIPLPYKKDFWNILIEFTFEYNLRFRDYKGDVVIDVKAYSIHKKRYILFSSTRSDIATITDLFTQTGSPITGNEPYIITEASAIALKAELRNHCDHIPVDVTVTIGLFSIIKLCRLVCLNIQTRGFCIPPECNGSDSIKPNMWKNFFGEDETFALHHSKMFSQGKRNDILKQLEMLKKPCDTVENETSR